MIDFRQAEILIVEGLTEYLASRGYDCPVIMANQTSPIPPYPYISYTVITPVKSNMAGYCIAEDGTRYKELVQTWSFTAQSDDDVVANQIAMEAYDYFALAGNTYLSDNDIVAQEVGSITNRDNLLTNEYEYRRGFDVDFTMIHTLSEAVCTTAGFIETVELHHEVEVK